MRVSDALTGQNLPRMDVEVLLAWILGTNRAGLIAHPDRELTQQEYAAFADALTRRRKGEPMQYITGEKEFYGRVFAVDRRALIPRGATEELLRIALAFLRDGTDRTEEVDTAIVVTARARGSLKDIRTVVDIGTGSGCIGVTLALERPDLRVIATDISSDALALAQENAVRHGVQERMMFLAGAALHPLVDLREPFVIVSNPPYIPAGRNLMADVLDYEPHVALFGGPDGGDVPRTIWNDALKHPFCRGIVMECMEGQL
jgi:release factor glutamine methyltransferase